MHNYQKKLKNQKYKNFQQLKSDYNYLMFCRYYDLTSQEIINLKIFLNNKQIKFKIIKQNLLNKDYNIKGQGSLFTIYFNNFEDLILLSGFLKTNTKIEPLFLCYKNQITAVIKLNKILNNNVPLPYKLKTPLFNIYQTFLNITRIQANITQ